jgi:hypothetical protein
MPNSILRGSMNMRPSIWRWGWVVILAGWLGSPLEAQTPALGAPSLYRHLFVVDTSSSMGRVAKVARQTVHDLIFTGVQGQMKQGDLYTVWVFNEDVYTNRYAPMAWDVKLNQALANGALKFLQEQKNEKQTHLEKLWAELKKVAMSSDVLTVYVITDGDDKFAGTPFDGPINTIYKEHYKELRRAKKPFITTFLALRGRFVAFTVGPAGDPIRFGDLAQQIAQGTPLAEPIKSPSTELPPPVAETAAIQANQAPITSALTATSSAKPPVEPAPSDNVEIAKTEPTIPPAVPEAQSQVQAPQPTVPATSQPPVTAESPPPAKTEPHEVPDTKADEVDLAKLLTKPGIDMAQSNALSASRAPVPVGGNLMATDSLRKILSSNRLQAARTVPADNPGSEAPSSNAQPANVAAGNDTPPPPHPKVAPGLLASARVSPPAQLPPAAVPTRPIAVVEPFLSGHGPLILGGGLVLVSMVIAFWFVHRLRAPRQGSFISRSIERQLK